MMLDEELVERLARRRSAKLGGLSEGGFAELVLAVREDPSSFVDSPADEAFLLVAQAVRRVEAARNDADLLDDEEFYAARQRFLTRLSNDCAEALRRDENCIDARILRALAADTIPDQQLDALLEIERDAERTLGRALGDEPTPDAWSDIEGRPLLRVMDNIARTCIDSARYRMANDYGQRLLALAPSDVLGARHTCAIALARLEDEQGFEELEARIAHRGDSWQQLCRMLLFYKLGRMPAARRALRGFAELCEGGAYALMRPVMVDIYLPTRPETVPYSYHEVVLAVNEADPVVCDVPDLYGWVDSHDWFAASARNFADRRGLQW